MDLKEYKKIKLGNLAKSFSVEENSIDVENRRVKFALSSEEPYERYFGIEILGHNTDEVDLSRLQTGAPWLAEHDSTKQIGIIEEVSLDKDKVLRVLVRFSKNPLATEYFNDIVDGIRTKVSVGYQIMEMEKVGEQRNDETGEVTDIYRVTKWMPYEGSSVSIPADNSVGIGRNLEEKELTIFIKSEEEDDSPADEDQEEEDKEKSAVEEEIKNVEEKIFDINNSTSDNILNNNNKKDNNNKMNEHLKLGRLYGDLDLAVKFIEEGKSVDELKDAFLAKKFSGASIVSMTSADAGESKERKQFNLSAYLVEQMEGKSGEHTARAKELANGKEGKSGGFILPRSIFVEQAKKDYVVGTPANGGNLAPNTFHADPFDALWNNSVVLPSVTIYPSGVGSSSHEYPIITGKHTFQYVGENEAAATSNATVDKIKFTPKYFSGATTISRQLLKESAIRNTQSWVITQMLKAWDEYRDNILLNGDGASGHITGLSNLAGVNVITTGGTVGGLDYKKVVEMETLINFQNANKGKRVYLTNSKVEGYLKTTPQMNNSIAMPILMNGQMNGITTNTSNQIALNTLMLVNGEHVHYMEWDGYEVFVNPYKDGGLTKIELFAQFDMQVSHPQGVSICKDIVLA